ncbi:MAG: right-handed parallel beta-helix repeat-containing protein [Actinobacteria bacterium]|nr:right-handed parallel beta-helix repeat-containing protein [Actinomycetota bacterium]
MAGMVVMFMSGTAQAATYFVTNTNDSGLGSFRQAIITANGNPGADFINFNIGAGPNTISPLSALPNITDSVTIDGYTEGGSSPATNGSPAVIMIELDGTSAGAGANGLYFAAGSDISVVRGLVINRFSNVGVEINGPIWVQVEGNYIGTDVLGAAALGNGFGVYLPNSANANTIGGTTAGQRNIISGNTDDGVVIDGSTGNNIQGNYIGTDVNGTAALKNGLSGMYLCNNADSNTIGGTTAGHRNIISGNNFLGVYINGSTGNDIQGNYIGTNVAGTAALANGWSGVLLFDNANNTMVGGSATAANRISFNGQDGVRISTSLDCEVSHNQIHSNTGIGVVVMNNTAYRDKISKNSIYGNGALGIDLGNDGVTPNDGNNNNPARPNRGYNFPVISSANLSGGNVEVAGTTPPSSRVELFYTGPTPDPSNHGEGRDYLGSTTADGSGNFSTTVTGLSAGDEVSATAISQAGAPCGANNTSEFSANYTVEYAAPTVTGIIPSSGTNDGTINITNLKGTNFRNGATVKLIGPSGSGDTGAGTINATNVNVVSSTKITCKFNLNGATAGKYNVKVENTDGKSGTKANAFTVNSASSTWYLAEGTTAWGYSCYISIENPNTSAMTADITYMTGTGEVSGGTVNLPASSQTTVNPADTVPDKDFSTKVECKEGKTIAVDRTMSWTGEGATSPDGHCSIGVTSANTTWYLAEGSSAWGFECWLLIQNPNATEATAQVTYMIEGEDPVTVQKKIPANSRETYNMTNDIGEKDASIKVQADIPIIPERAMYKNNRRSGHDSIGTTAPAATYYLAEGTTDWGFTTYVLIQNPNDTPTEVNVTYLTTSGDVPHPANPINMPANSRYTIRVNDFLPGSDFSTQVTGSNPIIAERAMYWGADTTLGEAAHDSIGMSEPHITFYLPDGQAGDGYETYTLVANPNDTDTTVQITYLTPDGAGNVTFEETIGANSRMTYSMGDAGINGGAAVLVTSKTAGSKIMVERAMYWNTRGAGTDTIGGYSD